jgi:hypothetical protein
MMTNNDHDHSYDHDHDHADPNTAGRRSFLRKVAVGAFAVPTISTFTMGGVRAAVAQTPTGSDTGTTPASTTPASSTTTTTTPASTTTTTAPASTTTTTTAVSGPDYSVSISGPDSVGGDQVAYFDYQLTNLTSFGSSGNLVFDIGWPDIDVLDFAPASPFPSGWVVDRTDSGYRFSADSAAFVPGAPGASFNFRMKFMTNRSGWAVRLRASIPPGTGGDTNPANDLAEYTFVVNPTG